MMTYLPKAYETKNSRVYLGGSWCISLPELQQKKHMLTHAVKVNSPGAYRGQKTLEIQPAASDIADIHNGCNTC